MRVRSIPAIVCRFQRLAAVWLVLTALAPDSSCGDEPVSLSEPPANVEPEKPPTPQELMTARGLVRYRSMWRTVQEIELIERADRVNLAQKEWVIRLERLRKRLDDPKQAEAAAEEVSEIADPFAVPALAAALAKERMPRVRACYVDALSHIRSGEAMSTLVAVAVDHVDPETRILAVERLRDSGPEMAAQAIMGALGGADNDRINRAAEALGRLGSTSAIAPLIGVLETDHVVMVSGAAAEGSTTATFTPSGGGLSMGSAPKRQKTRVQNQRVLEALVRITGENFAWNTAAWQAWLANRQLPPDFDPRRG